MVKRGFGMSSRASMGLVVVCALLATVAAHADSTVLRMATVAPEGTAWSREFRAFGREVTYATGDKVHIKWYFSGVAGDERECVQRIKREQLDGAIGSGNLCAELAPSMRALAIAGLFHDADEAISVMNRMKPHLDAEFFKSGFINVAEAGMGFHVLLSRTPIRTLADLKKSRYWVWDLDQTLVNQLPDIVHLVPLPVEGAARAFDENKVDGFIALPTASLACQWSTQAHYYSPLKVSFLPGCMVISVRAFDSLSSSAQQEIRAAAAKLQLRIEDAAKGQDQLLLSGLFARQGLQASPLSEAFVADFTRAAHEAEERVDKILPPGARSEVTKLLGEYRRHRNSH